MDVGLSIIESSCTLVAAATGGLAYKKMPVASRLLFFQTVLALLSLNITYVVTVIQVRAGLELNNHVPYNVYILCEALLLFGTVYLYSERGREKTLLLWLVGLYLLVFGLEVCFFGFTDFLNYTLVAESLILTVFSLLFLYRLFNTNDQKVFSEPLAWFSLGFIIYYACCIPYFSLFDFLNQYYPHLSTVLYESINNVLVNIRYLCVSYGFWLIARQKLIPAT